MTPVAAPPAPPVVDETALASDLPDGELLVEESLVEEVSIDGMCGVY
jgi:mycofactocin precursor